MKMLYTVLIVEDSLVVVKFLSIAFKNAGFKVKTASDGYEALEKAIKDDINLIVTDLNMPEMDGITLLNSLKENLSTKNIPVILMSSNTPGENEISKSYAFLQKPFNDEKIISIAKKAIKEVYGT
ncbi:MAG: response regulator [Deltaproteobacteria bacterium]|jgi:two-component system chemotaxis response regulator CheY|nr:response regulator [Deltaproteobacteria bacterium]MCL5879679.1 response regulator [Deltaproteobacteria bacterium]MDA8304062.1 response regulator [Deltaproteobacteria bacterium]